MKHLVDFAPVRETPPELLRQLRAVDPNIDLLAVTEKTWWLGSVNPNIYRYEAGEKILANESRRMKPNPMNVILGRLSLQGFARIQAYHCAGDPSVEPCIDGDGNFVPSLLEDFKERHFNWLKDQGAAVFAERSRITSGEEKAHELEALLRDKLMTDGRAEFRRVSTGRIITSGR